MSFFGDVRSFIRTWGVTGAVAPSGRALARRMAAGVDPSGTLPFLELGPGTGVVTEALIARGIAPSRIIAIEYNPDFARAVERRCPGVRVIVGDAYDLAATLAGSHAGPFQAVVSSLPLLLREEPVRKALIVDALRRTAGGGPYIQFSYSPKPPVPASPEFTLSGSGFILANIPPARVWTYRLI